MHSYFHTTFTTPTLHRSRSSSYPQHGQENATNIVPGVFQNHYCANTAKHCWTDRPQPSEHKTIFAWFRCPRNTRYNQLSKQVGKYKGKIPAIACSCTGAACCCLWTEYCLAVARTVPIPGWKPIWDWKWTEDCILPGAQKTDETLLHSAQQKALCEQRKQPFYVQSLSSLLDERNETAFSHSSCYVCVYVSAVCHRLVLVLCEQNGKQDLFTCFKLDLNIFYHSWTFLGWQ